MCFLSAFRSLDIAAARRSIRACHTCVCVTLVHIAPHAVQEPSTWTWDNLQMAYSIKTVFEMIRKWGGIESERVTGQTQAFTTRASHPKAHAHVSGILTGNNTGAGGTSIFIFFPIWETQALQTRAWHMHVSPDRGEIGLSYCAARHRASLQVKWGLSLCVCAYKRRTSPNLLVIYSDGWFCRPRK